VGGAVGLAVARAGAFAVDLVARRVLPDFPFRPASYFSFEWPIVLGALACAVGAAALGAWFPARRAARLDPSEALTT
jgi:ABC-type antimicrobial peptide transport system permease subunit